LAEATHQKPGIHIDGGDFAGARHWRRHCGIHVIYAALMNPYPYPAAERIVRMTVQTKSGSVETINLTLLHAVRSQLMAVNSDQQRYGNVEDLDEWISDEPEWQQEACGVDIRRIWRVGPGSGGSWALQRGVLLGRAADQRVWHSHGLGRAARPCAADRLYFDSGEHRQRHCGWTGAHAGPEHDPREVGKG
jgi:hypothetical protein